MIAQTGKYFDISGSIVERVLVFLTNGGDLIFKSIVNGDTINRFSSNLTSIKSMVVNEHGPELFVGLINNEGLLVHFDLRIRVEKRSEDVGRENDT